MMRQNSDNQDLLIFYLGYIHSFGARTRRSFILAGDHMKSMTFDPLNGGHGDRCGQCETLQSSVVNMYDI